MKKNWKRIVVLLCVMALGFGSMQMPANAETTSYTGSLSADSATNTGTNFDKTKFYMTGTDSFPLGDGNGWDSTIIPIDDADSGIFINGERINNYYYVTEDGSNQSYVWLRKYTDGKYYIQNLPSIQTGDVVTIKGTFYVYGSWKDSSVFEFTPVTYEESMFKWDGAAWSNYEEGSEEVEGYTGSLAADTATNTGTNFDKTKFYITGTDSFPVGDNGWNCTILPIDDANSGIFINGERINDYFYKTSDEAYQSYVWLRKYADGKYYIQNIPDIQPGDVLTIKGTFYVYGDWKDSSVFEFTPVTYEESMFKWDGTQWADYVEITSYSGSLSVTGAEVTNNQTLLYLKGTDEYLKDNTNAWTGLDEEKLVADSADADSGIWLGETKQTNAFMKKYSGSNNLYLAEGFTTPATGDVVTIKGTFYSQDGKAAVTYEESKFQWNGTNWIEYVELVRYDGTLTTVGAETDNSNSALIYLKGTDEYLKDNTNAWTGLLEEKLVADSADADSGIWLGETKQTDAFLKKYSGSNNNYLAEGYSTPSIGDIVTIKGTFYSQDGKAAVTFAECKLMWNGIWMDCSGMKSYQDGTVTLNTNNMGSAVGLYLLGSVDVHENCSPEEDPDFGWTTSIGTRGIYKNGELCDAVMKNIASGAWYVDLGNAGIEEGDILTINGVFGYDGNYVKIAECSLMYVEEIWVEGLKDTGVSCDMNVDGELNLKDYMRLKKHLTNKTTPICFAQMDVNADSQTDKDDLSKLFEILIK